MPALITTLVENLDNSELICDQIAAILATESAAQQALATLAGKNPKLWKLRVFAERTNAWEMRDYCQELVASADHMRPNFWPNTPDILHETLQHGGPAMFKIRAVLAATLSPSWGMYSGYELFEHLARPGAEEYLDNEKYELRPRDWAAAEKRGESLAVFIGKLNGEKLAGTVEDENGKTIQWTAVRAPEAKSGTRWRHAALFNEYSARNAASTKTGSTWTLSAARRAGKNRRLMGAHQSGRPTIELRSAASTPSSQVQGV